MADFRSGQRLRAAQLNDLAVPGMELIEELNLASDSSFTDIPQDFRHLQILMYGGLDADSATDIFIRFNDDNDTNYTYWLMVWFSDDSTDPNTDTATGIRICHWQGVGSRSQCVITINDYASSHWQGAAAWFASPGGGSSGRLVGQGTGSRDVSEAVSAISFHVVGSGNTFSDQTIASLYGLR